MGIKNRRRHVAQCVARSLVQRTAVKNLGAQLLRNQALEKIRGEAGSQDSQGATL
jgi:hypothetical protein